MATFLENNNRSNTGRLYYKKYYDGSVVDKSKMQYINDLICNAPLLEIPSAISSPKVLHFITTYPGLVMGTGYTHEQKKGISEDLSHEAFKIGFFFDYTSGMPIIPGSSVKGLLRSAFPQRVVVPKKVTSNQIEKEKWIKEILALKCNITNDVDIDELEREIFDGYRKEPDPKNVGEKLIKSIPIYERDIFFDAVPCEITANNLGQAKRLLGSDYITPHKNKDGIAELDPFSNPTPLKFLKIMPKVKIEFRFKLEDSTIIPELNAEKKKLLFQEIIKNLGIGAKTNVGYGQFEEGFEDQPDGEATEAESMQKKTEPSSFMGKIKQNEQLEAVVIDQSKKLVKAIIHGNELFLKMAVINCPENETVVQVKINTINKKNEILQVGFIRKVG